eukprot:15466911-Alexandrium_andersonii.AAC.1
MIQARGKALHALSKGTREQTHDTCKMKLRSPRSGTREIRDRIGDEIGRIGAGIASDRPHTAPLSR